MASEDQLVDKRDVLTKDLVNGAQIKAVISIIR